MGTKLMYLIPFILFSCSKKDLSCNEESKSGTLMRNAMIQIGKTPETDIEYFEIVAGDNIVFTLIHSGSQCDNVVDDEWGEQLVFQVEEDLMNFSIQSDGLDQASCFYGQFGAWVNHRKIIINSGLIEGERINENEWIVKLNVKLPEPNKMGDEVLEFEGAFIVKDK